MAIGRACDGTDVESAGAVGFISTDRIREGTWDFETDATIIWTGEEVGDGVGDVMSVGRHFTMEDDSLVVASSLNSTDIQGAGAVYILQRPSGNGTLSEADVIIRGDTKDQSFGTAVEGSIDLSGDGIDELIVLTNTGSPLTDGTLIFESPHDAYTTAADATMNLNDFLEYHGQAVASAGDVDYDGHEDLIVGTPSRQGDAEEHSVGGAIIVFGPVDLTSDTTPSLAQIHGDTEADLLGETVASAGDIDDDNHADVLLGSRERADGQGGALLFRGPISGVVESADAWLTISGETKGSATGLSLGPVGDLDFDGADDFVLGAEALNEHDGAMYLFFGQGI